MAGFRIPGVLCVVTNAMPIDTGTLTLAASPASGPVGAVANPDLSEADLDLIRTTTGRNIDGSIKPLQVLLQFREDHIKRKAEVTRDFGAQSWHALFEAAVIERFSELIELAQSPAGKAAEQLNALIAQAQQPGSTVTDAQLSDAVAGVLGVERQRQLLGATNANGESDAMALVVKAMEVFAERKQAVLVELIAKAKRPGSPVTDDQLSQAVAGVLGAERQRQLLGVADSAAGEPTAMDLVIEATDVFADRKNSALEKLIAKAKAPGSTVTDEQLSSAVSAVLGIERQRQLLGISDGNSGGKDGMALVVEAAKVSLDRKRDALAKLYEAGATEAQIAQATKDYENAKAQFRMLGGSVPDASVSSGPMKLESRDPKPK